YFQGNGDGTFQPGQIIGVPVGSSDRMGISGPLSAGLRVVVQPGQSVDVELTFDTSIPLNATRNITITSNDPVNPLIRIPVAFDVSDIANPSLFSITHTPPMPSVDDIINITAQATDDSRIASVIINYSLGGPSITSAMSPAQNNTYYAAVDLSGATSNFTFQITATDIAGNQNTSEAFIVSILIPDIDVTPGSLDFGTIATGSDVRQNFTVANRGNHALESTIAIPPFLEFTNINLSIISGAYLIASDDSGNHYFSSINGNGSFGPLVNILAFGFDSRGTGIGDFDEDGDLDFVTGNPGDNFMYIARNRGNNTFESPARIGTSFSMSSWVMDIAVGDYTTDRKLDFVVSGNNNDLYLFAGDGLGGFTRSTITLNAPGSAGRGKDAGDLNGDGKMDFAYAENAGGTITAYLGSGNGTFNQTFLFDTAASSNDPYGVTVADFDNDGNLDIIANGGGDGEYHFYKGAGNGVTFTMRPTPLFDTNNHGAADNFDFDSDGLEDLVITTYSTRDVRYYRNSGNATFTLDKTIGTTAGNVLGVSVPVSANAISVPGGSNLTFEVKVDTSVPRNLTGNITFRSNDPDEGVLTVTLTGRVADITPPVLEGITNISGFQSAERNITVEANASDNSGIFESRLFFQAGGGQLQSVQMARVSGNSLNGTYKASIPPTNATTMVGYFVNITDLDFTTVGSGAFSFDTTTHPDIENITQTPIFPNLNQDVSIMAGITDDFAVSNATLFFSMERELSCSQASCVQPPSGLIAWWPADGAAADVAGGNGGVLVGGAGFAAGKSGEAFNLDGISGRVDVPSNPNLNPSSEVTVSAWVKTLDAKASANVLVKTNGCASSGYIMWLNENNVAGAGKPGFWIGAGPWLDADIAINDGQWHHVAGTFNGTASSIYVDGVLRNSGPRTGSLASSNTLQIGGSSYCGANLNGQVDDAMVFDRALSAVEIESLFNSGGFSECSPENVCTGFPQEPASWWPAEGNADDVAGSNQGFLQNGAGFGAGAMGEAFSLDGINDYVRRASATDLPMGNSPRTMAAWIYPTAYPDATYNGIVAYGAISCTGQGSLLSIKSNGQLSMAFWCDDAFQTSGPSAPLNKWTQVALTYEGGTTVKFYMNGEFVQESPLSAGVPANTQPGPIRIGCTDDPGRCFRGMIDEAMVFNRSLTAAEMKAMFEIQAAGRCTSLASCFDGISMSSSGSAYSATIPGFNATLNVSYFISAQDNHGFETATAMKSFVADGDPPNITGIGIDPPFPNATAPVEVFADIEDNVRVGNASLFFRHGNGSFSSVPINLSSALIGRKIDVLVLGADSQGLLDDVRSKLLQFSFIRSVDTMAASSSTPTLSQLQDYDAVITWSDNCYANSVQLGNALADYVDNGGGVVTAVFSYNGGCLELQGRFAAGNYYTIPPGSGSAGGSSSVSILQPGHPILKGFNTLSTGSSRAAATAATSGSDTVANWGDGRVLVATKGINQGRVVGLGFWPPSSDVGGSSWNSATDGDVLMANSLLFAAGFGSVAVIPAPGFTTGVTFFINAQDVSGNAINSSEQAYIADGDLPVISSVTQVSGQVTPTENVTIQAIASDNAAIASINLSFRPGSGSFISVPMVQLSGTGQSGIFEGVIPASVNPVTVTYFVTAADPANNSASSALFSYQTKTDPIIREIKTLPGLFTNTTFNLTLQARVDDPDNNLLFVNFTLIDPDGIAVLERVNGAGAGNLFTAPAALVNKTGIWAAFVEARDADLNIAKSNDTFLVDQLSISEALLPSTTFISFPVNVSGFVTLSNGTPVEGVEVAGFLNGTPLKKFQILGDGSDGNLTINSNLIVNTYTSLASNAPNTSTSAAVGSTVGFAAGDEVLVIQLRGQDAGVFEFKKVRSALGNIITFDTALENSYSTGGADRANIIRVPQFTDVVINSGSITARPWDGTTGGVVAFRATGRVEINAGGKIDASGKGYRSLTRPTNSCSRAGGLQGESFTGEGAISNQSNGGGGGGGGPDACVGCTGDSPSGGGGYGTLGLKGEDGGNDEGQGGGIYGTPDLSRMFLGSAGGESHYSGTRGGSGGGIIFIFAGTINASQGQVLSNGEDGNSNPAFHPTGGGSGGSIHLVAKERLLSNNTVKAKGGDAFFLNVCEGETGGKGGDGRIRFSSLGISGSADPAPFMTDLSDFIAITDQAGSYNIRFRAPAAPSDYPVKVNVTFDKLLATNVSTLTITTNNPPAIAGIPNQSVLEDTEPNFTIDLFAFTTDVEQNLTDLAFAIEAQSNPGLISCSLFDIRFINCTTPAPNQFGSSDIAISAFDGSTKGFGGFRVIVEPVNDQPVLGPIPNQTINEDQNPADNWIDLFAFASDVEDSGSQLNFSILSQSNASLISCSIAGDRFVNCTDPAPNEFGSSEIFVEAIDTGGLTAQASFFVFVNSVNDLPVVTLIAPPDETNMTIPNQTFTFAVEDVEEDNFTCSLVIGSTIFSTTQANESVETNITATGISEGRKTWQMRCSDGIGNGISSARFLNVYTDLAIFPGDISFSDDTPLEADTVAIKALVRNLGSVDVNGVTVSFFLDNASVLIGNSGINIAAGSAANASVNWKAAVGNHTIIAQIDPNNARLDLDRSNNEANESISVILDQIAPTFSTITLIPADIRENSANVDFTVNIFDVGVGVDTSSARLFFGVAGMQGNRSMAFLGGNTFRATLNRTDVDWDLRQGNNITFFVSAKDRNNNANSSPEQSEFIDVINDVPIITIFQPNGTSQWGGNNTIKFSVNNDNEGPVDSTLYYWQPSEFAPRFEDNPAQYFLQGEWVEIANAGNASELVWDTTVFDGFTRVNITTTDGVHAVGKLSDIFVVDNTRLNITIDNFAVGGAFVTKPEAEIFGTVDAGFSNISSFGINDSRFTLATDPRGRRSGAYRFRSNGSITSAFSIGISAADSAGNTASMEGSFVIDQSLPAINMIEFENAFTNDIILVRVNATDDIAVKSVSASLPFNSSIVLSGSGDIFTATFKGPPNAGTFTANITATDQAGNVISSLTNLTVLPGPDLTVSAQDITFEPPATTITGSPVNVTALIRNTGGKFANGVNVSFTADGIEVGRDSLNITGEENASIAWDTTGFAGNKTVVVNIERSSGTFESSYLNNNASAGIFIDGPDLAVVAMHFNPPAPVFEGQVVNVTATIQGLNQFDASGVRISFYRDSVDIDNRIDFKDITVPAGGLVNVSVNWQTAGQLGNRTVFAEANTLNLPADPDRSNNILNATFLTKKFVPEQIPDLLFFSPRPLEPIPGERVRGLTSNDFQNDMKIDFVAGTDTGRIVMYKNNGIFYTNNNKTKNVNFTQVLIDDIGETAWGMASADFERDGYPDLLVGTESGKVQFYNNSQGVFVNNITLLDLDDWAYGLAVSDFNNDNIFDVVVGTQLGQVNIYANNMTAPGVTNESMVFNQTITTRDLPFGITTGDYDLDGQVDIMVGDRLGQVERLVFEEGKYNGFVFTDVGAFAHGLTTADVDYSGKLDLFTLSFDGNIRMFFSREGGLVTNPFIVANVPNAFGLTSGDYDRDNDIDLIAGGDNGDLTFVMNSLRISKSSVPLPSPPRRPVEVFTTIQDPWSREMDSLNVTEFWGNDTDFIRGGYPICLDFFCEQIFYADIFFLETPTDSGNTRNAYFFQFPNQICKQTCTSGGCGFPHLGCSFRGYTGEAGISPREFNMTEVMQVFDSLDLLNPRESFKMRYKVIPNSATDISAVTSINYTLLGDFNTPRTSFLLSDDVSNMNDITANSRNINPTKIKTDRDFTDNFVVVPDFTPTAITFEGFSFPPVPGEGAAARVTIRNLNNIAINGVKIQLLVDGNPVIFGCPQNCRSYTTFNIGAFGTASVSVGFTLPAVVGGIANVTAIVNPLLDDLETDYTNNVLSNTIATFPPTDLSNEEIFFTDLNGNRKTVFTEGEVIQIRTNISNVGADNSYSSTLSEFTFQGRGCDGVAPIDTRINCTPASPDFNAGLCDGFINPNTNMGNVNPGEGTIFTFQHTLADSKSRSQGGYNISTVVSDVASGDTNLANSAMFAAFEVLPSQEDLKFDYGYGSFCTKFTKGIGIDNPSDNVIRLFFEEMNDGGHDINGYDSVIFLDNNDSVIVERFAGRSLINHTASGVLIAAVDWDAITPGDHRIDYYIDYGRNDSESTARVMSSDGLAFVSNTPGIAGNEMSASITNRDVFRTELRQFHAGGSTALAVNSVAGLAVNDTIRIEGETFHAITGINVGANTLTITPPLSFNVGAGADLFQFYPGIFRLTVTRTTTVFEQTAFDITSRVVTQSESFDRLADGVTDIMTVGDILNVTADGGFNLTGQFFPSSLLHAEAGPGANLSAMPSVQASGLILEGSAANEVSEANNRHSTVFRWKEIAAGGITTAPNFPAERDIVSVSSTISNGGDIRTEPFNVSFYLDGVLMETRTISLLAHQGQPMTFLFEMPRSSQLAHSVRIAADSSNVITHEDESNNNVSSEVIAQGPFELNVLSREHNINFLASYQDAGGAFTPTAWALEGFSMEYDAIPEFVDYDRDGDLDVVIGSLDGKLESFRNTGTNSAPAWEPEDWLDIDWTTSELPIINVGGVNRQTIAVSTLDVGARSAPEFADLDGDTLADLVVGDTHGKLRAYKRVFVGQNVFNPGTGQNEFIVKGSWAEFGFNLSKVAETFRAIPRFADLDGDADLDLIIGNQFGNLMGYENTGTLAAPDWAPNGFNLTGIGLGSNAAPDIKDLDGDGDFDAMVGSGSGIITLQNIGNSTDPAWNMTGFNLSIPGRLDYRPALADLDADADLDLVFGSNNFTHIQLRKGYFEPVNVQVINFARKQVDIGRVELSAFNGSNGNKITQLFLDGPKDAQVLRRSGTRCDTLDIILKGKRIGSQSAIELEYDIDVPQDMPDGALLGVRASKQENVNPSYFYELGEAGCGENTLISGSKGAPIFINRPQLGGNTFDLFVDPNTTFEYKGSYRVFFNGTMSRVFNCVQNWCPIYNLVPNETNTIVGSGEIRRFTNILRMDYDIVKPDKPAIQLQIDNKFGLELKPGYVEDVDVSVTNNNRRAFNIDRIAIELFDQGPETGQKTVGNASVNITVPTFDSARIISLFTDTNGFNLPPGQTVSRKYKVYIPDGVPLEAMLLVKGVEKHTLGDNEYDRSNIAELWPQQSDEGFLGGRRFASDLPASSLYDSSNVTLFTDPGPWGDQDFQHGINCIVCDEGFGCGFEESFLRKLVWIPKTLIKSEQKIKLQQNCCCGQFCATEPPSGVTSWINGELKTSQVTECADIEFGWTPNFDELKVGGNSQFDLYSLGPHRQFDITFYDSVTVDYIQNTTVEPIPEAFQLDITGIGENGLLRRQFEEAVNFTVTNNDDDPATVDVIKVTLVTPQNKKVDLKTDTTPRTIPPQSSINLSFRVIIPSDVPLRSRLAVQVERVFSFPDRLWNRNREATQQEILAEGTRDYHWGDTLPTGEDSKYRKHFFVPRDVTRAEMVLGDQSFTTDVYLNGEFQGSGYPGWSPISITSGLKQAQENIISAIGSIPDTDSRVYSGKVRTGGTVIEPERDVFFTVFGMRERAVIPDREPFFVLPGEDVTARIRVENKYDKRLDFTMRISVVDFRNRNEVTLRSIPLAVLPFETKNLEVDLAIPATVSNETRLQLSSVWNELLDDKNWLRGSNFNDDQASNKFLDDTQWGVVQVGPGNEKAIYFRKDLWVDSTVQEIRVSRTGTSNMWVNGLPVAGNVLRNEFTKSESNLITLKAASFNIDADITLDHFVPVRSTDLEVTNLNYSHMLAVSQGNLTCFANQSLCDCGNQTRGECTYTVDQGETVRLNFTMRNAGELFAEGFDFTVYARNVATGAVTEFKRETLTMHPFSSDMWSVSWDTSELAGLYEFVVFPDADDAIIETSESNNQGARKIYVNAGPGIQYLDSPEIQGYGENVSIRSEIIDLDNNINNVALMLTKPDNSTQLLNVSSTGSLYKSIYNNTEGGRYVLGLDAEDGLGDSAIMASRVFDLFDSLYLNVKTGRDVYFYTQTVRLTPATPSGLSKVAQNTRPTLSGAFDNAEEIKGGERVGIRTNAFDPDGDLLTLYVCKTNQAGGINGCSGGTYCQSTERLNPGCSFAAEKDDMLHTWFAFLSDGKSLASLSISGNYTTDSAPPATRLFALASDTAGLVDAVDDSKTIAAIQGEPGMRCRWGKDLLNRFHKDRSYSLLENECAVAGEFANCNLGNLTKVDPSKDKITNLTRAYVSCVDVLGNEQVNSQNVDIEFGVEPEAAIFDDYQGGILAPGSSVSISGDTTFCVDETSRCIPSIRINNSAVAFSSPGAFHLRYIDADGRIMDTTVLVNSGPAVSGQAFRDVLGEHAFEVLVKVSDADSQAISCTLSADNSTIDMEIDNGLASALVAGMPDAVITTRVTCTDGFEAVSTPEATHAVPNQPPQLRNIPDMSLEPGQVRSIDLGFFGTDMESDAITHSIVSQGDTQKAMATITGRSLSVTGLDAGRSEVCLKVSDGLADSNVQCINMFVEDGTESKLQNNEFSNTTVGLLMKVQFFDGSAWMDEFTRLSNARVLPGPENQAALANIFEWNSATSSHPEGLFRVLFMAVDGDNATLVNRDGTKMEDSYNFTLILFNTPPEMAGIPDEAIFENGTLLMDLLEFTRDNEQDIAELDYAVAGQGNTGVLNCSVASGHVLACSAVPGQIGTSGINVSVTDVFGASDSDSFTVSVIPLEEFMRAGNLTFAFASGTFNLSGDLSSGFRSVFVDDSVQPGTYQVQVTVSDSLANVSRNITVLVAVPGQLILNPVGDRATAENATLDIQLTAIDPAGAPLLFGTDALSVLPSQPSFNAATGLFSWTPAFDDSGNYSVLFNVTNGNQTGSEAITIEVLNTNRPPVLDFMPDVTVNETETAVILAVASDPDNQNAPANDDNNLTVFINDTVFVQNGSAFLFQTGFDDAGFLSVLVTVGDGILADSQAVSITILDVNRPPVLDPVGDRTVNENEGIAIQLTASDPDNDTIIFNTDAGLVLPGPFAFNETAGLFSWIPTFDDAGEYNITFIAFDGQLADAEIVTITVVDVPLNRPPVLDAIGNRTVDENETLLIQLMAADPDNDTLAFGTNAGSILPSQFAFNAATGLFEWTPTFNDSGIYSVTFNVSDGQLADNETISITVRDMQINATNRPPVLDPVGNRTVGENESLAIQLSAADPDNDTLIFTTDAGSVLPSAFAFNAATGLFEWIPTLNDSGIYSVTFSVSDGLANDSEMIAITVIDLRVNRPPVLDAVGNKSVARNETLAIMLSASDPDNDTLAFGTNAGSVLQGPFLFDPATGFFQWTRQANDSSTYMVLFNVTDGLLSDEETITIFDNTSGIGVCDPRTAGYWSQPCNGNFNNENRSSMESYLARIHNMTDFFDNTTSFKAMCMILDVKKPSMLQQANRQLLALWLNLASRKLFLQTQVNLTPLSNSTTVSQAIAEAESLISVDTTRAKDIAEKMNMGGKAIVACQPNNPPVMEAIGNRTVPDGGTLIIQLSASDPDGDAMLFSTNAASVLPEPHYFDAGTGYFEWAANSAGTYTVTFAATDGSLSDREEVAISVLPPGGGGTEPPVYRDL
ncbi:MAG: VCBS repeat-containing protein, partial [Candidatus Aenigmarchaeota archaeon]|nr:VCBS repeat-containing protein [Candidatus Aenigmarchaeota archaeon]